MSAEPFLSLLEQDQLLPPELIAGLRKQVANSARDVSATAVAKLLIEKGHLTKFQAQQLLQKIPAATAPPKADPAPVPPKPAPADADEFGLAPLEEDESPRRQSAAPSPEPKPPAKPAPADSDSAGSTSAPSGGSLLEEELGLSAADDDGDALLDDPLLSGGEALSGGSPLMPTKKKRGLGGLLGGMAPRGKSAAVKPTRQKGWDAPVILVGGGLLVFLVLLGVVLLLFLFRGGGNEMFQLAEADYRAGSYRQAISKFEQFLASYPNHPEASTARVHRGMARLRQATESTTDFSNTLNVAKEVIREVEDEEAFLKSRDELRTLLPTIAEGLAQQAQQATDTETVRAAVGQTREALVLVANTKYVPKSQRPEQRIQKIEEILTVVERDLSRDTELAAAIERMQKAVQAGDAAVAYQARAALLKAYPDLAAEESLAAAAGAVTELVARSVQVVGKTMEAETTELPSPLVATLRIASRQGRAAPGVKDRTTVVRADGVAYGLNVETGSVAWREVVGNQPRVAAVAVDASANSDVLLVDARRAELVRRRATDGKLVWRLPAGDRVLRPVVVGDEAFVTTEKGRLLQVQLNDGNSSRQAVFPQAVGTPPAIHPGGEILYVVGDHSNLYVVARNDFSCREVFYLGHAAGTVDVSPVVALDHLVVAENWGAEDSTLHVLTAGSAGADLRATQQIRLRGHVVTPPIVFGRQVVVATDRGEIRVFEIGVGEGAKPLVQVAQRLADNGPPMTRYLAVEDGRLWVADRQLARYAIQTSGNRLVPQAIETIDQDDTFIAPLQQFGGALITVRRRAGLPVVSVAAVDMAEGRRFWDTDAAMKPAGPAIVDQPNNEISVVTASGSLFRFDRQTIQAGIQDTAIRASSAPSRPTAVVAPIALDDGNWAYVAAEHPSVVLVYTATQREQPLRWLRLPSELASCPAAFGRRLLCATSAGQVMLLDPQSGRSAANPFQPRLEPGTRIAWRQPGVSADAKSAVVSDGDLRMYRLEIRDAPAPHLAPAATVDLSGGPVESPVAILGGHAMAVDQRGQLVVLTLDDLAVKQTIDVAGPASWGPRRVGKQILLINNRNELIAIKSEGQIAWRSELPKETLVGDPLAMDDSILFVTGSGLVQRIDTKTGNLTAQLDIEQPLAASAARFGPRLVVVALDGTILVTPLPTKP